MICNCAISSSLVFEILWFPVVYWMGLCSVIVVFHRYWYLRDFGSLWCTGLVYDL